MNPLAAKWWAALQQYFTAQPAAAPATVTLKTAPGYPRVNFFLDLEGAGNLQLEAGTRCIKLERPIEVEILDVPMKFYKLDYNGLIGYVNARWVSE